MRNSIRFMSQMSLPMTGLCLACALICAVAFSSSAIAQGMGGGEHAVGGGRGVRGGVRRVRARAPVYGGTRAHVRLAFVDGARWCRCATRWLAPRDLVTRARSACQCQVRHVPLVASASLAVLLYSPTADEQPRDDSDSDPDCEHRVWSAARLTDAHSEATGNGRPPSCRLAVFAFSRWPPPPRNP